jgi:hypothetical protein
MAAKMRSKLIENDPEALAAEKAEKEAAEARQLARAQRRRQAAALLSRHLHVEHMRNLGLMPSPRGKAAAHVARSVNEDVLVDAARRALMFSRDDTRTLQHMPSASRAVGAPLRCDPRLLGSLEAPQPPPPPNDRSLPPLLPPQRAGRTQHMVQPQQVPGIRLAQSSSHDDDEEDVRGANAAGVAQLSPRRARLRSPRAAANLSDSPQRGRPLGTPRGSPRSPRVAKWGGVHTMLEGHTTGQPRSNFVLQRGSSRQEYFR